MLGAGYAILRHMVHGVLAPDPRSVRLSVSFVLLPPIYSSRMNH